MISLGETTQVQKAIPKRHIEYVTRRAIVIYMGRRSVDDVSGY